LIFRNPNGTGLPNWPVYTMLDGAYLYMTERGGGTREAHHFRRPEVNFWSKVAPTLKVENCDDGNSVVNGAGALTATLATLALAFTALLIFDM